MDFTSSTGSATATTTVTNTVTNTNNSFMNNSTFTTNTSQNNESNYIRKGTKDTIPTHKSSNTVTFAVSQPTTPPSIAALPTEHELSISHVDVSQESSNYAEEESLLLRHSV
jgi:hypothetical protein